MTGLTEMSFYWFFTGIIMVIPSFVCSLIIPKRNNYIARYISGAVISCAVCFLDIFIPMSYFSILIIHIIGILFILWCNRLTAGMFVYYNIWCIVLYFVAEQLSAVMAVAWDSYDEMRVLYVTKSVSIILISVCEVLLLKYIGRKGVESLQWRQILLSVLVSVVIITINSISFRGSDHHGMFIFLFQLFSMLVVALVLYLQVVIAYSDQKQNEAEFMKYLIRENKKNYEMKKAYVDLVDRKYHDMKYEIRALRQMNGAVKTEELDRLEKSVDGYRNLFQTGNEVLDTIINDKRRECEERGILFTCSVRVGNLDFINIVDLNILLGNLIDNAIEAVFNLPDAKKVIDLKIYNDRNNIRIREMNYYSGELKYSGNELRSTKQEDGYHGFGTKSMKYIVEKYKGEMVIQAEDGIFQLSMRIPAVQS